MAAERPGGSLQEEGLPQQWKVAVVTRVSMEMDTLGLLGCSDADDTERLLILLPDSKEDLEEAQRTEP